MGRTKKPCYYCGTLSTSAEHIPPKQLFTGFGVDKITVPACDAHNTAKSGEDDAIVKALVMPLVNKSNRSWLTPNTSRIAQRIKPHLHRVKNSVFVTPLIRDGGEGEQASLLPYLSGKVRVEAWMQKLTAGLIYDGLGRCDATINWSRTGVISPDWFPVFDPNSLSPEEGQRMALENREIERQFENEEWTNGWRSGKKDYPPDLYSFKFWFRESDRVVIVRHHFLNTFRWFVTLEASESTFTTLRARTQP